MQCLSCGTELQAATRTCPRCGAPVSLQAPPPPSFVGNNDPTIPANYGPFRETASASPASPLGGIPPQNAFNARPTQNTPPASNSTPPPYDPYYGQPYYANQPSYIPPVPPAPLPLTPQPPPKQRRGLSRAMLILLSILVLLMIVGAGIIYYFSVPYPAQLHAQATSTAQARVNAVATATAQAIHNANATVTAQAQATLTAQQNFYAQATNGNPATTDSLAKNSPLNWNEYDSASNGGCIFNSGMYHVKEVQTGFFQTCFAQASNFSNFTFQVQMTILSGEYGGLVFRADDQNSKFYFLQLGSSGSYELFTYINNNGNNAKTLLSSYSTAIKGQNQPNLITLIARGRQLTVYVNKQYVDTVSDNTYKTGLIGLVGYNKTITADVAFSNLQVWKL